MAANTPLSTIEYTRAFTGGPCSSMSRLSESSPSKLRSSAYTAPAAARVSGIAHAEHGDTGQRAMGALAHLVAGILTLHEPATAADRRHKAVLAHASVHEPTTGDIVGRAAVFEKEALREFVHHQPGLVP